VIVDPELLAVLLSLGVAVAISAPGLRAARKRRRELERFCATCRRLVVRGVKTCDCD
jgi:hypothetical protein